MQSDTRLEVSVRFTAWGINGGTIKKLFSFNSKDLFSRVAVTLPFMQREMM
jgi:hypothetical protein